MLNANNKRYFLNNGDLQRILNKKAKIYSILLTFKQLLKITAQTFEAGDFLNIFLMF